MQVIHTCCCGLDIHKKFVVACLLQMDTAGVVQKEVRTSPTMTQDLLLLGDWLSARHSRSLDCRRNGCHSLGRLGTGTPPRETRGPPSCGGWSGAASSRLLLTEQLSHWDYLDEAMTQVTQEIEQRLQEEQVASLIRCRG